MKKISHLVMSMMMVLFVFSTFSFMGCTRHPNDQQLQALEEQKSAALSAENTLEDKRKEKSKLQNELTQKQKELQATKAELDAVKQRLTE